MGVGAGLCMYDVVVKKVHVRYLICWRISCRLFIRRVFVTGWQHVVRVVRLLSCLLLWQPQFSLLLIIALLRSFIRTNFRFRSHGDASARGCTEIMYGVTSVFGPRRWIGAIWRRVARPEIVERDVDDAHNARISGRACAEIADVVVVDSDGAGSERLVGARAMKYCLGRVCPGSDRLR